MDNIRQQVIDRLKQANNILVTVRNNPTVDLLSACIGLSLVLDKLDKHAAAVFSGEVPSAMEFLKPEETIEQTPNSLRDFIIALDKSKADKLRYKVEDKVVRIFITPYKTSLTQEDLEFSQGDFNVDVVVALGAHEQQELDEAITEHGRILHDAAVVSINNTPNGNLGSINWQNVSASSISEMVAQLVEDLGKDVLDEQIATALLTGIVAETARFSNEKTTPETMGIAGELMAAGANQQLVASGLQQGTQPNGQQAEGGATPVVPSIDNGTLEIAHKSGLDEPAATQDLSAEPGVAAHDELPHITPARELLPMPEPSSAGGMPVQSGEDDDFVNQDKTGRAFLVDKPVVPATSPPVPERVVEPSSLNPLNVPADELPAPLIRHDDKASMPPASTQPVPVPPAPSPASDPARRGDDGATQTLADIEHTVHSSHLTDEPATAPVLDADMARQEVQQALSEGPSPIKPEPLQSIGASFGPDIHPPAMPNVAVDEEGNLTSAMGTAAPSSAPNTFGEPTPLGSDDDAALQPDMTLPLPPSMPNQSVSAPQPPSTQETTSNAPPPVPPPWTPNFMNPS